MQMFEVLLVNGQRIWVDPAGARNLQQEGRLLYVVSEKEINVMGRIGLFPYVPNIFPGLTTN